MQNIYATHVPLATNDSSAVPPAQGAREAVAAWARGRLGLEINDWQSGSAVSGDIEGHWSTSAGAAGELSRLETRQPDDTAPWNWHTTTWIGTDSTGVWVRLRISLKPHAEGIVIDPRVSVGAPRFLGDLAAHYRAEIDGRPIETFWRVGSPEVTDYVLLLESSTRHLPIVAVTRQGQGNPAITPQVLARRLSGIAHVVAIEPAATYAVSDLVTPTRSVFGGAIRVYWPGFNRLADPYRHPLFMSPGQRTGIDAFADDLAAQLGRAAGSAFGPPSLEMALRREADKHLAAEARRRLDEQTAAAKAAQGGLSAEEFELFSREFERLDAAREAAAQRVHELERELEEAREAAAAQRQAWAAFTNDHRGDQRGTPSEEIPETVLDAVRIAADRCPDLVFTQSAYESARESQYSDPSQVLADLATLQDVAHLWATNAMTGDFKTEFDSRPVTFRGNVSNTALNTYSSDYTITHDGKQVLMGPHLRRGVGAPSVILRIYWHKDDATRKLIVGHVGRKLRDDSNRN